MNGFSAGHLCGEQYGGLVEIALRGRGWSDADRGIRPFDVDRVAIGFGMDHDRPQAEAATGPLDAKCDLAAIGDQDGFEHASLQVMRISGCPASTRVSGATRIASRIPSWSARISLKVFIASITQTTVPALIASPTTTKGGWFGPGQR